MMSGGKALEISSLLLSCCNRMSRIRPRPGSIVGKNSARSCNHSFFDNCFSNLDRNRSFCCSAFKSYSSSHMKKINPTILQLVTRKHHVLKQDRNGYPFFLIQTPGKTGSSKSSNTAATSVNTLPILNMAAFLDKREYCRRSATASTSLSGLEASRRLHHGQLDLRQFLIQEPKTTTAAFQCTVLQGHGIPVQLLQHYTQMAKDLFSWKEQDSPRMIQSISFHRCSHDLIIHYSNDTVEEVRSSSSSSLIRTAVGVNAELSHSLELYLTSMSRVARALLLNSNERRRLEEESDHPWLVRMKRGTSLSVAPAPGKSCTSPVLILQWLCDEEGKEVKSSPLSFALHLQDESVSLCYTVQ